MKDCLGQDEIYQLLPGPRTGSSLLPHTGNVGLLWNGCLSWAAQAGQGFSSPGLCQKAGGVGVNQAPAVLSSCRCFSVPWHCPSPWSSAGTEVGLGPAASLVFSHLFLSLSVLKEHVVGADEARQS